MVLWSLTNDSQGSAEALEVQAVHVGWQIAVETDHRALTTFIQRDVSLGLDLNIDRIIMPNIHETWIPAFITECHAHLSDENTHSKLKQDLG